MKAEFIKVSLLLQDLSAFVTWYLAIGTAELFLQMGEWKLHRVVESFFILRAQPFYFIKGRYLLRHIGTQVLYLLNLISKIGNSDPSNCPPKSAVPVWPSPYYIYVAGVSNRHLLSTTYLPSTSWRFLWTMIKLLFISYLDVSDIIF